MRHNKTHSAAWREWVAASTALCFALQPTLAFALPTGGVVSGGAAVITGDATSTTITQSTGRAIIDWNSFDVSHGEAVRFVQPDASSIAFNRIHDSKASTIDGALTANGNVWFSNAHGMVFGNHAQVNVGGLVATTADMDNGRFMAGQSVFDIPGDANASIVNHGTISIGDYGLAALVAPTVTNTGTINARLGKVQLASGDTFTIDPYGDGLINLQASAQLTRQLIENNGTLTADGGTIQLTAAASKAAVDSLINMGGMIQANSMGEQHGKIIIYAEGSNAVAGNVTAAKGKKSGSSTVLVSGRLDASGRNAGEGGGAITVAGDKVSLVNARIDASGETGGGTINIGGDYLGGGDKPTALNTSVDANSQIYASALSHGDGGKVIVWADNHTSFAGYIEARGSAQSGNGGFVETSGHQTLDATGIVSASAANGNAGTWLLDPANLVITSSTSNITTQNNTPSAGNTTYIPDGGAVTSNILNTTIQGVLDAGTNVYLTTGGDAAGGNGDITVSSTVTSTGTGALTLSAYRNINVNQAITLGTGGALTLTNGTGASGTTAIAADLTATGITLNGAVTTSGTRILDARTGTLTTNSTINAGANTLTLAADDIVLGGNISGASGSLIIRGSTNSRNLNLADPVSPLGAALNLSGAELNYIQAGFNFTTFGSNSQTGTTTLGAYANWRNNTTFSAAAGGAINVTGAQTFTTGQLTFNTAPLTLSANLTTNNSPIILNSATTLGGNVTIDAGTNIFSKGVVGTLDAGAYDLTITSNTITLSNSIIGTGNLTLQPSTANRTLNLTSAAGNYDLSPTEYNRVQSGFASFTIGRSNSSGNMTIGAGTFRTTPTFRTSGTITTTGTIIGSGSTGFTFSTPTTLGGSISTAGGNVTFNSTVTQTGYVGLNAGTGAVTISNTFNTAGNQLDLTTDNYSGVDWTKITGTPLYLNINTSTKDLKLQNTTDTGLGTGNAGEVTLTDANLTAIGAIGAGGIYFYGNTLTVNARDFTSLTAGTLGFGGTQVNTKGNITGVHMEFGATSNDFGGNITGTDLLLYNNKTLSADSIIIGSNSVDFSGGGIDAGAHNLTIITDIFTNAASAAFVGTGTLTFQPYSQNRTISLYNNALVLDSGGSSPRDFGNGFDGMDINIDNLTDGFSSITIGRVDGTGAIYAFDGGAGSETGQFLFHDPITFRGNGSTMTTLSDANVSGIGGTISNIALIATGNGSFTFDTGGVVTLAGNITTAGGNITFASGSMDGNGNGLQLDAGSGSMTFRDITNIDTSNFSAFGGITFNGDVTGGEVFADASAGDITLAANKTINSGEVTLSAGGDITMGSGSSIISNSINGITIKAGDDFINNSGSGALLAGTGKWRVYASDISQTVKGMGTTLSGFNRYGCNSSNVCGGGVTVPGAGNGFIFLNQPHLAISGLTANNKVYDATNAATLSGAGSLSGVYSGDTGMALAGVTTATFADKNVGNGKAVTGSGNTVIGNIYGYILDQYSGTANITAGIESAGGNYNIPSSVTIPSSNLSSSQQVGSNRNEVYLIEIHNQNKGEGETHPNKPEDSTAVEYSIGNDSNTRSNEVKLFYIPDFKKLLAQLIRQEAPVKMPEYIKG